MDDIPITFMCPLGMDKCRSTTNEGIVQCSWLVEMKGKDPQSEKQIEEHRCAMAWIPILLVETSQTNRGQTAAIESLRNVMSDNVGILQKPRLISIKGED